MQSQRSSFPKAKVNKKYIQFIFFIFIFPGFQVFIWVSDFYLFVRFLFICQIFYLVFRFFIWFSDFLFGFQIFIYLSDFLFNRKMPSS
jgi:hypothetical protein